MVLPSRVVDIYPGQSMEIRLESLTPQELGRNHIVQEDHTSPLVKQYTQYGRGGLENLLINSKILTTCYKPSDGLSN